MIKVLIIEDSPVMQSVISQVLSSDPELEIVGIAGDGEQGVSLAMNLKPDVITMDIRMPKMDGFEATRRIMEKCPTPIVVVCASVDAPDLAICYNAIKAGALTIVEKPGDIAMLAEGERSRRQLITTVKLMAGVKVLTRRVIAHSEPVHPVVSQPRINGQKIFAIASSTGGPGALHHILTQLPADFSSPILIVQHISEGFLQGLADWLNLESRLKVKIARQRERIQNGVAYLAPTDFHMELSSDGTVNLHKQPPVGGFRPSATYLFDSLGRNYGLHATGIILTGMGNDGVEGLKVIKTAGGKIIAQDEHSCVVFGMPKEAIGLGIVDYVAPLDDIPQLMVSKL